MSSEEERYTERVTELKKRRAVAKRNVTRSISKVNAAIEAKEETTSCAAHLGEVFEVFKDVHFKLVELITDEDELDVANTYFEKVAHDVFDAESRVRASQDARQEPTMASTATTSTDVSGVDLPAQALKETGHKPTPASISKEKQTSTPLTDATTRLSFGVSAVESMHLISEAIKSIMEESRVQQKEILNSINTPRVEIIKYDGSPLKYYPFMRSFKNTVESRTQDNAIRLDTLIQHCTGDVNELLQCCLIKEPDEGYELAMKMLQETYGDHDIIASAWLDRILKRPKLTSVKELGKYMNDLKTCYETLETMNYLPELQTRTHLRAIADKLPDRIYNRWAEKSYKIKEKEGRPGNLKEMMKFIDRVSKEASDATFPTKETDETSKPRKQIYAINSSQLETSIRKPPGNTCRKCSASHYLNQCDSFRALTVAERIEFVKENELCFNCFQADHQTESCPRSWRCNIEGCGAKHNRWLHTSQPVSRIQSANYHGTTKPKSDPTLTVTATGTSSEKTLLPVTTVLVKGPTGRVKRVWALFDNGSTGSMCSEALVEELLLPYQDSSASLTTVDRENHSIDCKLVDFEIQNLQASYSFKMRKVMTRESLNIHNESFITETELTKLPHLVDLEIPTIETKRVDLLIGQDHSELLVPLEVRTGKENEPFAIRTHLGWVFNGNMSSHTRKSRSVNFIDARLDQQAEKFWALDDPFNPDSTDLPFNDRKVMPQWEDNIKRDDNHYSMPIPDLNKKPHQETNKEADQETNKEANQETNKEADEETNKEANSEPKPEPENDSQPKYQTPTSNGGAAGHEPSDMESQPNSKPKNRRERRSKLRAQQQLLREQGSEPNRSVKEPELKPNSEKEPNPVTKPETKEPKTNSTPDLPPGLVMEAEDSG